MLKILKYDNILHIISYSEFYLNLNYVKTILIRRKLMKKKVYSISLILLSFSSCGIRGEGDLTDILKRPTKIIASESNKLWNSNEFKGCFTTNDVEIKDFWISPYETTKKEYKEIMLDKNLNTLGLTEDPSGTTLEKRAIANGENDENRPVENVSWFDAVYFCNLKSQKEGLEQVYTITNIKTKTESEYKNSVKRISSATVTQDLSKKGYRLPTEAEWEYAARGLDQKSPAWNYEYAGAKSQWTTKPTKQAPAYGKDSGLNKVGWYSGNSQVNGKAVTHEVGKKQPNTAGLYDMSGNVEEWTTTTFTEQYLDKKYYFYAKHRGGNFCFAPEYSAVATPYYFKTDLHYDYMGFRLARTK